MNFNNGNDNNNNNNKNNNNYVRAVRGGKYSLLSFASIYKAYLDCRRRKRGTINALRFEFDLLDGLIDLASDIQKKTYQPSRSVCFIVKAPKLREIFAADFKDRIVHHLVVRELEKQWEPRFIHDSYACRVDKGIHAAVKRLQQFMRKASANGNKPAYFLQLDIRSFFMSIDKPILFSIFKDSGISEELLDLLEKIIFHDCTQNYYFRGNKEMLRKIPPHKSLFTVETGKGLPIGNLTSQFFANVYLHELDQFVKHTLKCRYYIRYVDDFILIASSPEQLVTWRSRIENFLTERLALTLKPGDRIRRINEGADFLGYIVRPEYILVRRRVVNNLKYKLALFKEKMVFTSTPSDGPFTYQKIIMEPETIFELRQTLASYLGHFKHAQTWRLVRTLFEKHAWLNVIFNYKNGAIQESYAPKANFKSLRKQIRFFRYRLKGFLLFVGMGRFVEVYDKDAQIMHDIAGGELKKEFRGMEKALGFPKHMVVQYVQKALAAGHPAAILAEGKPGKFVKHRYVCALYEKIPPGPPLKKGGRFGMPPLKKGWDG